MKNKKEKFDFTDKVVMFHLILFPIFTLFNLSSFDLWFKLVIGIYCLFVIFSSCIFIVEYDKMKERLRKLEDEKAQSSNIHTSIN